MKIAFLGTGGGRYVTALQLRWTGGIRIGRIHVDPGPASIRAYRFFSLSPDFDAIFLSHAHIDHINDVNVLLERKKNVLVFGEKNALAYITSYHRNFCRIKEVREGERIKAGGFEIEFTPVKHSSPGLGAVFKGRYSIWYSSDTEIIEEHYKIKVDVALLNVLRPWGKKIEGHMDSEQAAEWALNTKPKLIIIQHFGRKMLEAGPESEARKIEEYSGVRTVAAKDGMVVDVPSQLSSLLSFF